jgi:hypothetical protein
VRRGLVLVLPALIVMGSYAQSVTNSRMVSNLATPKGRLSYALGMELARKVRDQSIDVDLGFFNRGLVDARYGNKQFMTDEEIQATLAVLTNRVHDRQQSDESPGQEPSSPSIQETLEYLNARGASSFVPSRNNWPHDVYIAGKFFVDTDFKTVWRVRWKGLHGPWDDPCIPVFHFAGALIIDLDSNVGVDDQDQNNAGKITLRCQHQGCFQDWAGEVKFPEPCGDDPAGKRSQLAKVNAKPEHADFHESLSGIEILTNRDQDLDRRFARALRHLIVLLQPLPQNRSLGPKDPFAQ